MLPLVRLFALFPLSLAQQLLLGAPPTTWRSLGPFPLGTRELPLLPPFLPSLSRARYPSPLADGGYVEWSTEAEDNDGWVEVQNERVRCALPPSAQGRS